MDRKKWLGIFFILTGVLALVHNLGWLDVTSRVILATFMLIIGTSSVSIYLRKDRMWLLLLIGLVTLSWGIGILLYETGVIHFYMQRDFFLIGIALGFLSVYFHNGRHWWAVIPGGVFVVAAVVDILDELFYLKESILGFLLFFGISLVFLYLYLIRDEQNRLGWAIYPAGATFLVSLFILYFQSNEKMAQLFVAVILILIGAGLILKSLTTRKAELQSEQPEQTAPADQAGESPSEKRDEAANEKGDISG